MWVSPFELITNAREVLGYAPEDDSEVRFAADIARLLGSAASESTEEATPGF